MNRVFCLVLQRDQRDHCGPQGRCFETLAIDVVVVVGGTHQ